MKSIESDEDEELPRIHPVKADTVVKLTPIQIYKLLTEDNPSEWEPGQNFNLPCNTFK